MSVRTTIYLMYATVVPYDTFDEAGYDRLSDEGYIDSGRGETWAQKYGVTVVSDGMGGKYAVVGVVHARSELEGYFAKSITSLPELTEEEEFQARVGVSDVLPKDVSFEMGWVILSHSS